MYQAQISQILESILGITVYIDDVLVTGSIWDEHMKWLKEVLKKFESAGVTLKKEKCKFYVLEIEFIGNIVDNKGIHQI